MSASVYYAIVKYRHDGHVARLLFADMTTRTLELILLSPVADVIEEGLQ